MLSILILTLLGFNIAHFARAAVYVTQPESGSTCHAGQDCVITWLDNGDSPLLSAMGESTVGVYTGKQVLVQPIGTIDVSKTLTTTFTPNPELGSDGGDYYISFISTTATDEDDLPVAAFSPYFFLDDMTGSIDPSRSTGVFPTITVAGPAPISTFTVGTLSTSRRTGPSTTTATGSTSRMQTRTSSSSAPTSSGNATASSETLNDDKDKKKSKAAARKVGGVSLGAMLLAAVVTLTL